MIKHMQSKGLYTFLLLCISVFFASCNSTKKISGGTSPKPKAADNYYHKKTITKPFLIDRDEFVAHAEAFQGIPYKYGSAVPSAGLDCSGLFYYLFTKHHARVPRVSRDFTNEGEEIPLKNVRRGDFLLFTGSDNSTGIVGHMGVVTSTKNQVYFAHSASKGVQISPLEGYWKIHFVKAIRLLAD